MKASTPRLVIASLMLLSLTAGAAASSAATTAPGSSRAVSAHVAAGAATSHQPPRASDFPGAAPWQEVARHRVAAECGLSAKHLQAIEPRLGLTPYAIYRYGKLCWAGGDAKGRAEPAEINSQTKTLNALLFGIVASRTDVDENTLVRDWVTMDEPNVDAVAVALTRPPVNPNATMYHVLTSTGHNPLLGYGTRLPWTYDTVGVRGMNSIVKIMDKIIQANPTKFPGSRNAKEAMVNELFKPLGMTASSWDGIIAAGGAKSSVYDMGKIGELLLRKGRWGDKQIVDEDYVYRMTHPQIEDVHTGYGYLTWINSDKGVAPPYDTKTERQCSPFSSWRKYPHAPTFDAPSSNGGAPFPNKYDIGTFWGDGAGGQFTYVHRGLDLVMVVRDDEAAQAAEQEKGYREANSTEYHRMWRYVRPALIALDPVYKGDEKAFCDAYRRGAYAPSLLSPWSASSGSGPV